MSSHTDWDMVYNMFWGKDSWVFTGKTPLHNPRWLKRTRERLAIDGLDAFIEWIRG